jgi:hypothetical protein
MLLLDAHALLWYAADSDELPTTLKERFEDPATRVVVSVATQWELMVSGSWWSSLARWASACSMCSLATLQRSPSFPRSTATPSIG